MQAFGFAGGLLDTDNRFTHFGARDYDARTGRWLEADPIGSAGGANRYVYVENDPINFVDPSGLCPSKAGNAKKGPIFCVYTQSTGQMVCAADDGLFSKKGYSGNGDAKNNPQMQNQKNRGPLPAGTYTIGPVIPGDYGSKGSLVMRLTPDSDNQMFGRDGFLIHGDSRKTPGTASEGCIIMGPDMRGRIARHNGGTLIVAP